MNAIKTTEVVFYDDNFNKFSERDYAKADPRKKHDFEMLVLAIQTYKVGEAIRKHDDNHAILGMYVKAASFGRYLERGHPVLGCRYSTSTRPHAELYQQRCLRSGVWECDARVQKRSRSQRWPNHTSS